MDDAGVAVEAHAHLTVSAYCFSFWWAMSVVIGAAVPMPRHMAETMFTTIAVFLGFLSYAWIIGSFTAALSQLSLAADAQSEKRNYIAQYLSRARVPALLRDRVDEFLTFYSERIDVKDDHLADLPRALQSQLDLVTNRSLFVSVPFLKNCQVDEIKALTQLIQTDHEWPGKTVVQHDQPSKAMFLIARGYVKAQDFRGVVCGLMCEPDYFGAVSLDEPSGISVCTVTMCQFVLLPAGPFLAAIANMSMKTRDAFRRFLTAEANDTSSVKSQQDQLRNAKVNFLKERWRLSPHNRELRNLISEREREVAALKPASSREKASVRFSMVSSSMVSKVVRAKSAVMPSPRPDLATLSRRHETASLVNVTLEQDEDGRASTTDSTSLVDVTLKEDKDGRPSTDSAPPPPPLLADEV